MANCVGITDYFRSGTKVNISQQSLPECFTNLMTLKNFITKRQKWESILFSKKVPLPIQCEESIQGVVFSGGVCDLFSADRTVSLRTNL